MRPKDGQSPVSSMQAGSLALAVGSIWKFRQHRGPVHSSKV